MKKLPGKFTFLHRFVKATYSTWRSKFAKHRLRQLAKNPPVRIILGASGTNYDGWIPTDVEHLNLLIPKHWEDCFERASIDAMLAEHVWEHLSLDDGLTAAKQCFEYLKPGGYLRVAVPDGFHPDPSYIEYVKVGGSGLGADDHKVLYNAESIAEQFSKAGFEIELLEYYDSDRKFHMVDWEPKDGAVTRSSRFDARNSNGKLNYTSLIIDARKPTVTSNGFQ